MEMICFSGQAASGKDIAANFLADVLMAKYSAGWSRLAFASPVKDIFCQAFRVTRAFIEEWKRNPEPPPGFAMSVRKGLQFIGDGFREINGNVWVDMCLSNFSGNGIISDGRYVNEGRAIRQRKGLNVVMWRPGFENDDPNRSESEILEVVRWCLDTYQTGEIVHRENEPDCVKYYHYFLRNDGTIDDLYRRINDTLLTFVKMNLEIN